MRYSASGGGEVASAEAYRRLAVLLARSVRTGRSAREVGREAGEEAAALAAADGVGDPVEVLRSQAERMGFRPRVVDGDLELRNCPFRDVADVDPATVCSLHLGLAEGVVDALGGAEVTGLEVRDPHRAGCRIHLRHDGDPD
jgi:predicted ArsR family transcriptional regulator